MQLTVREISKTSMNKKPMLKGIPLGSTELTFKYTLEIQCTQHFLPVNVMQW